MFGLGMGEIVVILVVALIVLGPTQLPDAAKHIGKAIRQLRKHTRDLQDTIEKDEQIGGTVRELKSALRGDEIFREPLLPTRVPIPPPIDEKPIAQGEPTGGATEAATATAAVTPEAASDAAAPAQAPPAAPAPPSAGDEAAAKNTPPTVDATRDG